MVQLEYGGADMSRGQVPAPACIRAGETIADEIVDLDACLFLRCRLVRCQVVYSGDSEWRHQGTTFEDCTLSLQGRAAAIAAAIAQMLGPDYVEALAACAGKPVQAGRACDFRQPRR